MTSPHPPQTFIKFNQFNNRELVLELECSLILLEQTDLSYLALGNSGLGVLEGEAQGIRTLSPTKDPCNRLGSHQAPLTRTRKKEEIN